MSTQIRYKTIPNIGACNILNNKNRRYCLPIKVDCTPTAKYIVAPCGQTYCQSKTDKEMPFTMKYAPGDKIMLQFQLDDNFNEDPSNPEYGWGDFVTGAYYDADGNLITEVFSALASDWLVGWDGDKSYQVIVVDTSKMVTELFNIKCWSFKITSHLADEGATVVQEYCSQLFEQIQCDDVFTIEGVFSKYDCFGNYYGSPVKSVGSSSFKYSNKLSFKGYIRDADGEVVRKYSDTYNLEGVEVQGIWKLVITEIYGVPAYVKNTMLNQMFGGSKILINGEEYLCKNPKLEPFEHMFICNIEVFKVCQSNINNC